MDIRKKRGVRFLLHILRSSHYHHSKTATKVHAVCILHPIYAYPKQYLRVLIHTHEHSMLHILRMVPKSCEVSRPQNRHSTERSYAFMFIPLLRYKQTGLSPPSSVLYPSPSPNALTARARYADLRSPHDHHITMMLQRYNYFLNYARGRVKKE